MILIDDECMCGYSFSDHPEGTIEDRGNGSFRAMIGNAHAKTTCTDFRLKTNLRYLEEKYEEKEKDSDI